MQLFERLSCNALDHCGPDTPPLNITATNEMASGPSRFATTARAWNPVNSSASFSPSRSYMARVLD
jgi:hypothetical protein